MTKPAIVYNNKFYTHIHVFISTSIGPQYRTVSGQAFVVHEHAHQTSHILRGLRPSGDRQPRLSGRLLQLFHTENASGRQHRRSELILRLVSTRKNAMDTRKCYGLIVPVGGDLTWAWIL